MIKHLLLIVLLGLTHVVWGQLNGGNITGRPDSISPQTDSIIRRPPLRHFYTTYDQLSRQRLFADTSLQSEYEVVDPSNNSQKNHIHLGYIGSSSSSLEYNFRPSLGFNYGFTQYDLYKTTKDSFRVYRANRTIADLAFYQINGNQNNFIAKADYSQKFSEGIQLDLNYKRYNFEHAYKNADNQSTSLGILFSYESPKKRWKSSILYLANRNNEAYNGGIINYASILAPNGLFRSTIPVHLSEAQNRHSEQLIEWKWSSPIRSDRLNLHYTTNYKWNNYLYYDKKTSSSSDTLVYGSYLNDDRGIRFEVGGRSWQNRLRFDADLLDNLSLNLGVNQESFWIDNSVRTDFRNDVNVFVASHFSPFRNLNFEGNANYGLGENNGNYHLGIAGELGINAWVSLQAELKSFRAESSLIAREVLVNFDEIYSFNWNKILGNTINVKLASKKLGLSLFWKQHIHENLIFWNSKGLPDQYTDTYFHHSMGISTRHKLWKFGLENSLTYQSYNKNLFHLPEWFSTHKFYFESPMFRRNLLLNMGVKARIIPEYNIPGFTPIVGQFSQNGMDESFFPEISGYITGKVKSFRIVFQYDNIFYWFTNNVNSNVAYAPMLDANLRFGIRWLLLD